MGPSPPATAFTRCAPDQRQLVHTLALALALNLVAGSILQWYHIRWGLVLSQVLFIAGPVLLSIHRFGLDGGALVPLRRPRGIFLSTTLLGTLALSHLLNVAGAWHERLLPPPQAYSRFFADLFVFRGPADFAIVLLVFAVVPAICEEVLFRGYLLGGLLAIVATPGRAILIQAMIFALFHFDPWRLPEILALGVFLGFVAQRSGSLIPAILAHALNNALSITLAAVEQTDALLTRTTLHWSIPCAVALLAIILHVMQRASAGRPRGRVL